MISLPETLGGVAVHTVGLDDLLARDTTEVDGREISRGARPEGGRAQRRLAVGDRVAVLGLVLAVEDERAVVLDRELRADHLLADDERLERMQKVLHREL